MRVYESTIYIEYAVRPGEKLTATELAIIDLIKKGFGLKEISEALNMTYGTARVHKRNINRKTTRRRKQA